MNTGSSTGVELRLNWLKRLDSGCSLSRTGCAAGTTEKVVSAFLRGRQIIKTISPLPSGAYTVKSIRAGILKNNFTFSHPIFKPFLIKPQLDTTIQLSADSRSIDGTEVVAIRPRPSEKMGLRFGSLPERFCCRQPPPTHA
jgi:hypothetical protein